MVPFSFRGSTGDRVRERNAGSVLSRCVGKTGPSPRSCSTKLRSHEIGSGPSLMGMRSNLQSLKSIKWTVYNGSRSTTKPPGAEDDITEGTPMAFATTPYFVSRTLPFSSKKLSSAMRMASKTILSSSQSITPSSSPPLKIVDSHLHVWASPQEVMAYNLSQSPNV